MCGVDICMNINYTIDVPNEYSADFWKLLTDNFNVILTKKQHSINGEKLHIELKILDTKTK